MSTLSPTNKSNVVLTSILVGIESLKTVTSIVLFEGAYLSFPSKLTYIVVAPTPTAVILPFSSITTTLSLLLVKVKLPAD